MLTAELPQQLQDEFERTAKLLHNRDGIRQALIEAIELWLSQQHQKLTRAEAVINNQAFETLRDELEQTYPDKWVVIANGKLLGAANTPEELNHLAPLARHRIITKIGQTRPDKVELGWQATFA
jgi:hypothetical protein